MIQTITQLFAASGTCNGGRFLGFPTWYHYLGGVPGPNGTCSPQINALSDVWLVVAAGIEILLQAAALIAVGFLIYNGFMFITSNGDPSKAAQARQGAINAAIGLIISVTAAAAVGFVAGQIK